MSELWEGLQSVLPIGLLLEIECVDFKIEDTEEYKRLSPVVEEESDQDASSILSYVGSDTYGSNAEFWARPAQIILQHHEDKSAEGNSLIALTLQVLTQSSRFMKYWINYNCCRVGAKRWSFVDAEALKTPLEFQFYLPLFRL